LVAKWNDACWWEKYIWPPTHVLAVWPYGNHHLRFLFFFSSGGSLSVGGVLQHTLDGTELPAFVQPLSSSDEGQRFDGRVVSNSEELAALHAEVAHKRCPVWVSRLPTDTPQGSFMSEQHRLWVGEGQLYGQACICGSGEAAPPEAFVTDLLQHCGAAFW
jgi:hypothetical protein